MNKLFIKKEKLFNIYSQNLSWVKEHPKISFSPDFDEGCICPLCLNLFQRHDLLKSSKIPLTFDHNPPKSLGGKQGVLTCKDCNSRAGHSLDIHLLNRLEEMDFWEMLPKSQIRATLDNGGYKVNSDLSIADDGSFNFNIDRKNSNPSHANNFLENRTLNYSLHDRLFSNDLTDSGWTWRLDFIMSPLLKGNERLSEIALLKIAYLIAFQKFGHGFIINPHLNKVREQILNPDKEILPKLFGVNYQFPEKSLGLNIINYPIDLQCFLIIFNLTTKCKIRQFAIALPGLSHPGLGIYDNLEKILCQEGMGVVSLNLEHLSDKEYPTNKKETFASYSYWKNLTSLPPHV